MATSVHIPKPLLLAVDQRARSLRISRNRLVIRALEREITEGADWPDGFFEALAHAEPELVVAVQEMSRGIHSNRRSKGPLKL